MDGLQQLHYETRQRGLAQAQRVLVLADGAVWIWKLAEDRFADDLALVSRTLRGGRYPTLTVTVAMLDCRAPSESL